MKIPKHPLYLVTLFFSSGMALSSFWSYPLTTLWLVCIGLFGLALSLLFFFKSTAYALLKTSLLYLCFLPLGALCYLNYYTDEPNHFEQLITEKFIWNVGLKAINLNSSLLMAAMQNGILNGGKKLARQNKSLFMLR